MTKFLALSLLVLLFVLSGLSSRDVVGAFSTDNVIVEYGMMSKPIMTISMPKVNVPAKFIKFPNEVVSFLEREGISQEEMRGEFMTDELALKICSICEGQVSEFCSIMCNLVAEFRNPQYEAYIVKVGNVFWTVYT